MALGPPGSRFVFSVWAKTLGPCDSGMATGRLGGFTLGAHHRMSFLIPMIYTSDVSKSGFFWMFLVSTVYSCYLIHLDARNIYECRK